MRILVTGATGLVGRRVVERLAPEHEVYALTRRDAAAESDVVRWVRQDLSRELDPAALPESVDSVVHLAQSDRYRDFPDGAEDIFAVNVHSTFRLLRWARSAGAASFVLASTGGLYGRSAKPIDESAALPAPGPYFRSKRMAELLLADYGDELACVALRFFFVYGPGPSPMLFARLAQRILAGEEIVIEGDPGMRMNPLFVDDAARAIEAALGLSEPAAINVAGLEAADLTEVVNRLSSALGREAKVRHTGKAPGDMVADTSAMRELLGVAPETSLDVGLRALADSLAGQPS